MGEELHSQRSPNLAMDERSVYLTSALMVFYAVLKISKAERGVNLEKTRVATL